MNANRINQIYLKFIFIIPESPFGKSKLDMQFYFKQKSDSNDVRNVVFRHLKLYLVVKLLFQIENIIMIESSKLLVFMYCGIIHLFEDFDIMF